MPSDTEIVAAIIRSYCQSGVVPEPFGGSLDTADLAADRIIAALTPTDTDTAIPAGWKLVPIEPTEAMIEAGERAGWDHWNSMPSFRAIPAAWSAMLAAASPKPDTDTPVDPGVEGVRDRLIAHLRREFGDSYDCQRVWSAWGVGTMDADDFISLNDRVEEIADGILAALAAKPIAGMDAGEVEGSVSPGAR